MSAAVRAAWRGASALAFGATAALAVTLSRPAPVPAAQATVSRTQAVPRCTAAVLAVSLPPGAGTALVPGTSRVPVDFSNASQSPCLLTGFPQVAAYDARGEAYDQVGNPAVRDRSRTARSLVLHPGATAHAEVDLNLAGVQAAACKRVTATGLRVAAPGQPAPQYLAYGVPACSAAGPGAPAYLSVTAIEPGPGAIAAPARQRHLRRAHGGPGPGSPAGTTAPPE